MTTLFIASDHAGVDLKATLQKLLPEWHWVDLGPTSKDSVDYTDYAESLAKKVARSQSQDTQPEKTTALGILICGSGIGMCIAANKISGIRAAMVESPTAARLSREHNNANVLCIGARLVVPEVAVKIVKTWLETAFTGEPRHQSRIDKITALEQKKSKGP